MRVVTGRLRLKPAECNSFSSIKVIVTSKHLDITTLSYTKVHSSSDSNHISTEKNSNAPGNVSGVWIPRHVSRGRPTTVVANRFVQIVDNFYFH